MNKTNIEWTQNSDGSQGYTWNPITGCLNNDNGLCKGGGFPCYAYKLANGRLKQRYLANKNYITWRNTSIDFYDDKEGGGQFYKAEIDAAFDPFYPRFWEERMKEMMDRYTQLQCCTSYPPKRGVFVCDMGDLFGIGVPKPWTNQVLDAIRWNGYDRFYILTKQAQRLPEFSPFPDNCWVGVTVTGKQSDGFAYPLTQIKATVKFISFEPLLDSCVKDIDSFSCSLENAGIGWLIIGACTGTLEDLQDYIYKMFPTPPRPFRLMQSGKRWTLQPKIEWVREIVEAADKAGVPVFLKDNLKPLLENEPLNPLYWANVCNDERGKERVDDSLRQEMPVK